MKFFFYVALFLFFVSCDSPEQTAQQAVEKPESSIAKKHEPILVVNQKFESKVENWKEYEALNDFIQSFTSITPNEALNNSRELNGLVKSLNDSIKPVFLEIPAFNARTNLLQNETLRLNDMSSISAIKAEEVNLQVEKILEAFSSVNSKINTLVLQSILDSEVTDVNFNRTPNISSPKIVDLPKKKKTLKTSSKDLKIKMMKEDNLKRRKAKLKRIKQKDNGEKKEN